MANHVFEPTTEQRLTVEIAASCGMPHERICQKIINAKTGKPIDDKTLRKVFRLELDNGMETANTLVAQNLFRMATGRGTQSFNAAKFWMMVRGGKDWVPKREEYDSDNTRKYVIIGGLPD